MVCLVLYVQYVWFIFSINVENASIPIAVWKHAKETEAHIEYGNSSLLWIVMVSKSELHQNSFRIQKYQNIIDSPGSVFKCLSIMTFNRAHMGHIAYTVCTSVALTVLLCQLADYNGM